MKVATSQFGPPQPGLGVRCRMGKDRSRAGGRRPRPAGSRRGASRKQMCDPAHSTLQNQMCASDRRQQRRVAKLSQEMRPCFQKCTRLQSQRKLSKCCLAFSEGMTKRGAEVS